MTQHWMNVRVDKKWREATDIYSFELVDAAGGELPPYEAGAHIDVEVAPGIVRQYSLCGVPGRRDRYQIGVLREAASRGGSTALIDQVHEGAPIRVSAPRNHFALDPAAQHSVLIAGGIGITPILSMAQQLNGLGASFALHYAVRSAERAAFQNALREWPFAQKVSFHFGDGPEDQHLDVAAALAAAEPGAHVYVCGPQGLIDGVLAAARAAGWAESRVHREYFAAPAQQVEERDPEAFRVKLASIGEVFDVPADRSLLAILAERGVEVPFSCEQGVCGTCLTRVLEGEPDHRDFFLTEEERARNDQILLCCSRSKTPVLVLDL